MTKIEAIIQPFKLDEVIRALAECGVDGMTLTDVKGSGRQRGHSEMYRGAEYIVDLRPKVKLEIVAVDDDVDSILNVISSNARTGRLGDGKVFLSKVAQVYRIRNGQIDEAAL